MREHRDNSRRLAAFIVSRWILTKEFPSDMLPQDSNVDRSFIQDLVYTTVRRFRPLRTILGEFVPKWPKGEMEALLLVGAAQILYMPSVKEFAAVYETVNAAKMCSNPSIARVVNGVLRSLLRNLDSVKERLENAPLAERESYPNQIVNRWIERFGEEGAEKMAKWHNTPASTYLAYNPNIKSEAFVELPHGQKVTAQEGYKQGHFIVQDPATAHAVELLDVKPGLKVLDYCAAPGGKTIQTAWRLNRENSRLIAMEVNPLRLERLRENLKRVKLDWVEVVRRIKEGEMFDRVLVDAPCSNSGVFRRRPDARWRWSCEMFADLEKLQMKILEDSSRHVLPGGILVYSTCSNEIEENEERIKAFLEKHPEFSMLEKRESIPFETGYDGAFACALKRK
ncbi:MAG: hypothetical protein J6V88_01655 [Kiritimatiellae bacterium]|nr:hypothetical protein [Kiritimatiellia bacterium]